MPSPDSGLKHTCTAPHEHPHQDYYLSTQLTALQCLVSLIRWTLYATSATYLFTCLHRVLTSCALSSVCPATPLQRLFPPSIPSQYLLSVRCVLHLSGPQVCKVKTLSFLISSIHRTAYRNLILPCFSYPFTQLFQ